MNEVTISAEGFTVDAGILAAAFRLDPAGIPERLRTGEITSQCETGIAEDAGRWRLTFYHGGKALRLIVDREGAILSRATFPAHLPRPGVV